MIVTQSRGNFADLAGFTERTSSVCCVVDFIDSFFLSLLSRNLAMIPASVEDVIKTTSSNSNQSERERESVVQHLDCGDVLLSFAFFKGGDAVIETFE